MKLRPVEKTARVSDLLLPNVAKGEPEAVRACINRFGGLVWSLARRMCPTDAQAEDAVQEIFVEVWKNAYRYDERVASETAFVAMLARRRLIDRRRRESRRLDRQVLADDAGPAQVDRASPLDDSDDVRKASDALTRLSDEQQRVLRLSIFQGLSHEKIATSTGLPLGTVKTHARRGLIKLRELLGFGGVPAEQLGDPSLSQGGRA
jgi:RNA polymerase sigma-70 factor (ECF subfamily)